ncbi:MAG: 2-C-methyl-D-erythritol 4-phosphate cytidylyltransferase [Clostridia bacterium]|nr:2-C-methyl-D-erythritol 4-phosphate cytidylyltransferase [Clostridia bacterium]
MIFAAILAGGVGKRMQSGDLPKQFLMLGSKPIVVHTVEAFLSNNRIDKLYIGVPSVWCGYTENLIDKYIKFRREDVIVTQGGEDRNGTIMNIISKIKEQHGEGDEHYIITHDAVRPFVSSRIINENIDAVIKYGAVDTAVCAVDTIVESEDGKFIKAIPERRFMYQGQTPQSFRLSLIEGLYLSLDEQQKTILTDACKICVMCNTPVYIVEGDVSNMKITTVPDYKTAQALVGGIISD